MAAYCENLTLENLNHPTAVNASHAEEGYIYANSKLCNIITSNILNQKLHGTGVTVNSLHPGVVHTNIAGNLFSGDSFLKKLIFDYGYRYLGKVREYPIFFNVFLTFLILDITRSSPNCT